MPVEEQNLFVELNRRFRKLERKAKAEDVAVESYTARSLWQMDSLSWDALLKENRVVILGEPGSGKSWEMQERARLLNAQEGFAFYVRLDQLVERELLKLLDADEQSRFRRWRQSQNNAYFFLDSVDEAKFRKVSDFHAALNGFRNGLSSDLLLRAKLFLSSRISEWKPSADGFEFQRLFPMPPVEKRTGEGQSKQGENPNLPFLVAQLEPLDRNQVERFAAAKGVSDVQAFVGALDRAFAWEFACRPLDVTDLIGFWNAQGRIGSLTELVEFDVFSKLRPRESRDEFPLSEAKGREGAEWLAAASIFSRRFSFGVPDNGSTNAESLDPHACLPANWDREEARALLNRAIFDTAVYGQFRFHHRRVGEYLAAKWVAARMENGRPPCDLQQVLVEVVRGREVLRPSLRAIAAWLCCGSQRWNELVRNLVLETDPGIHLRYGDPACLSLDYRQQVLSALARLSSSRRRMWIQSSPDCLARLADPKLSAVIAALILDRGLAIDFRIELLDIVRHGRLAACIDAAMSVVASADEAETLQSHAASAIGAMEDAKAHSQLFQVVQRLPRIPNGLCTSVVRALYPKSISSAELVQLLAKTHQVREFGVDFPFHLESHFRSVVTPNEAGPLLKQLVALAQTPPLVLHGQRTIPVSDQFYWVGRVIPTALEVLFQKTTLSVEETAVAAGSLLLLSHIGEHSHEFERERVRVLNRSTMQHPGVRRDYLWRTAAEFRTEHRKEPTMSLELFDHWEGLRLCPEDFSWLVEDIGERTEPNDRLLALRLAIEAWDASGRTVGNRWCLRRAVARDASLRAAFRQSVVTGPLFPLKKFWYRNVRFKFGKWWWRRKFDSVITRWRWLREQFVLLRCLRLIESGKHFRWLERLSREADEETHSHWAPGKWSEP